ncbi:MAG: hypothetical protein M1839_004441 [Geoglossum umbratile]|nr:MAG: hypothetical protein M1839_004441 [Geoglossum umbratile]
MGQEEQIEEREVLGSIFPDEIADISETAFRISIALDIPNDDDTGVEPPLMLLHVTYTENYPDDAPILDLSLPPSAPKYLYLDVPSDKAHLLATLTPTITENLGMQMIFTLVSALKESTEALIADRQAAVRAAQEAQRLKLEEEENRKFHGTPVTRESFLAWRNGFRKEMEEDEARRRAEAEGDEKKKKQGQVIREERKAMTGKELWEKGLVGKIDEDEEGDEMDGETLESGVGKLSVTT